MDKQSFLLEIKQTYTMLSDYISKNSFEELYGTRLKSEIEPLLSANKPKIMVYGIYNSGKSTLINALCRQEVAEVADRPMTSRIAEYDRGDFTLIDSPGVDAPAEHEMITEQYLNKCHIILFVMSSKGIFEDRSNYKRMVELIEKNIPFIIILNDRGCQLLPTDSPEERQKKLKKHENELIDIRHKIIRNLKTISSDYNVSDKYEIIQLNAKRALKGALTNKDTLYSSSNIENLCKRIYQILHDSNQLSVLSQPINNMLAIIGDIESSLLKERSGADDNDFENNLNILIKMETNLFEEMRIYIRDIVYRQSDATSRAILSQNQEAYSQIDETILSEIGDCYIARCESLTTFVNNKFKNIGIQVDKRLELGSSVSSCYEFGSTTLQERAMPEIERREIAPVQASSLPPACDTKPASKTILEFLIDLLNNSGKTNLEYERLCKEAEIHNAYARQSAEEEIRQRQNARQAALLTLDNVYKTIIKNVNDSLREKFDCIENGIRYYGSISKEKAQRLDKQLDEIKNIKNELSRLLDLI